jgi:hypothetical protein
MNKKLNANSFQAELINEHLIAQQQQQKANHAKS